MESFNEIPDAPKERHGCVTAWLVLAIIGNSIMSLVYLFASDFITKNLPDKPSQSMILLLGAVGIANVVFAFLLLRYKKLGFWGFAASSVVTLFINISIGLSVGQSLLGLVGVGILYAILQMKQNNSSTWDNLE